MFPQLIRSTWHSVYGHVSGMLPLELRQKPSPDGLTVTWTRRKEKKKKLLALAIALESSFVNRNEITAALRHFKLQGILACVCVRATKFKLHTNLSEDWNLTWWFQQSFSSVTIKHLYATTAFEKAYKTKLPACLHGAIMVNQTTMLWEWSTINVFRSVRGQWVKQAFGCMFWNE